MTQSENKIHQRGKPSLTEADLVSGLDKLNLNETEVETEGREHPDSPSKSENNSRRTSRTTSGASSKDGTTSRNRKPGRKDSATRALTYKTEICRSHRDLGYCEYEDKCQFAHGVEQLRSRKFSPKYKTQPCKNYHKHGNCRFGSRCQFVHDEERIQVGDQVWLVSPSENLVRIETVGSPDNVGGDSSEHSSRGPSRRGSEGPEVMTLPRDAMPLPLPVALAARAQPTALQLPETDTQEVQEDSTHEEAQLDAPEGWQEDKTAQFQAVNGGYGYPAEMYSPESGVVWYETYQFMPPYGAPTCLLVPCSSVADFSHMHGLGVPFQPQEYAYPYYHVLPMQQAPPALTAT